MLLRESVRDYLGLRLRVGFSLGGRETGQEVHIGSIFKVP